jgi:hypothetical protein
MSQKKHICFYSNKDKWSKAFVEELAKTPWINDFEYICVDTPTSGARPTLPTWLKQVPTLVINGDENPIKTDTEVMNWLYEKKMKEPVKKTKAASAQEALTAEPQSWLSNEMYGFGDTQYSFLDSDTSTAGNGGSSIPGNFTFLNGASSPGDRESQASLTTAVQSQSSRSKKEVMFDKQMDMYKQQRETGIPQGVARQ